MIRLLILLLFAGILFFLGKGEPLGTEKDGTMEFLNREKFNWSKSAFRLARDDSTTSRFDPLFFCNNFPNGVEKVTENKEKRLRRNTPDSDYWMYEPQYHHWNTRFRRDKVRWEKGDVEIKNKIFPDKEGIWHWWSSERSGPDKEPEEKSYDDDLMYQQLMYQNEMRDAVKRRGFYFRTEVTAIKDREGGSILKGWFHLKVTLERATGAAKIPLEKIDPLKKRDLHEEQGTPSNPELLDKDKKYLIDRLMVSSRGLAWGMGSLAHIYHPGLVYTSGIGKFEHDFPKCMKNINRAREEGFAKTIEEEYRREQFLWCGAINAREHMPSNNFIYVRTEDESGYGPASDPGGDYDKTRKEIHLNFRLHHSFCNLFYEVDFIVAGVVVEAGTAIKHGNDLHSDWNKLADENKVFFVQRSLSTRLQFVTELGPIGAPIVYPIGAPEKQEDHEKFKFYESADRVPEIPELYCDEPLTEPDGSAIGYKLADVLTNDKSPYKGAIKSVVALPVLPIKPNPPPPPGTPEVFGTIPRVDLSYHDLHRTNDANVKMETPPNYFVESDRHKATVREEVTEWDKYTGNLLEDTSCRGWSLYHDTSAVYPCYAGSKIEIKDKVQWTGRCGNYKHVCEAGEGANRSPSACDAALYQDIGNYDTELAINSKNLKIDDLKFLSFEDPKKPEREPLRIKTLHPLAGNVRTWIERTFGFKYDPVNHELPELKTLSEDKLNKIWYNSTFTVPLFDHLNRECKERNQKIMSWGGCPLIPAHPITGKAAHPRNSNVKMKKKKPRVLKEIGLRGMRIDNPATLYIWDTRVIHSIVLTILTIFVVPISIFMARYYKETFMNVRVLYHHVWYLVHLVASLMTLSLLLIGMWRQFNSRWWLGVNRKRVSTIHRILGWVVIVLSFFMLLFGGLRPMHQFARGLVISFHWLFGMLIYIFLLVCMLSSVWIPASPSVHQDTSVFDATVVDLFTTESVFMTLFFWIIFDLGMHIIMSILAIMNDRLLKLSSSRLYLPSIIPVVNENFRYDIPGFGARKILLWIYIIVAAICTGIIIVSVCVNSPVDRGFGWMSCTHDELGKKFERYKLNCAFDII